MTICLFPTYVYLFMEAQNAPSFHLNVKRRSFLVKEILNRVRQPEGNIAKRNKYIYLLAYLPKDFIDIGKMPQIIKQ